MTPANPGRLLGSHELAERWGITRARVFQIAAKDPRMPQGEALRGGRVWTLQEIEDYERVSGRPVAAGGPPVMRRAPGHQEVTRGRWRGFHLAAEDAGLTPWSDTTAIGWDTPVPEDAAARLGVPPGSPVVERERRHGVLIDGARVPVMLSWTYVHPDAAGRAPAVRDVDTGAGGITSRLIDAGYQPAWEEVITARPIVAEAEADDLDMAVGDAVLEVWRTCRDEPSGAVLEVTIRVINPALHELVFP